MQAKTRAKAALYRKIWICSVHNMRRSHDGPRHHCKQCKTCSSCLSVRQWCTPHRLFISETMVHATQAEIWQNWTCTHNHRDVGFGVSPLAQHPIRQQHHTGCCRVALYANHSAANVVCRPAVSAVVGHMCKIEIIVDSHSVSIVLFDKGPTPPGVRTCTVIRVVSLNITYQVAP
jgi:hypothetical protein